MNNNGKSGNQGVLITLDVSVSIRNQGDKKGSNLSRSGTENGPLTYADVADRRRILETEEGKYLLGKLPADMGSALTKSSLETGLDSPEKEILLRHIL